MKLNWMQWGYQIIGEQHERLGALWLYSVHLRLNCENVWELLWSEPMLCWCYWSKLLYVVCMCFWMLFAGIWSSFRLVVDVFVDLEMGNLLIFWISERPLSRLLCQQSEDWELRVNRGDVGGWRGSYGTGCGIMGL